MADTVDIQYIYPSNYQDAPNPVPTRRVVVNFAGISDGTGETEVTKVRLTDLLKHDGTTPTRTTIEKITATITGMTVLLAWDRAPDAEITLEANPDDLSEDYLSDLKGGTPINRLSIGIQSFQNKHLELMNRRHSASESIPMVDSQIPGISIARAIQLPVEKMINGVKIRV